MLKSNILIVSIVMASLVFSACPALQLHQPQLLRRRKQLHRLPLMAERLARAIVDALAERE